MCNFVEGCTLKTNQLYIIQDGRLRPLLTLISVIYIETVLDSQTITVKQNVKVRCTLNIFNHEGEAEDYGIS